jgi:type IV pilus assembly protein PilF
MSSRALRDVALAAALLLAAACSGPDRFQKPQPDKASDINLQLGIDHLRRGNLSEAKQKIERALSQNPRNANAQSAAGMLYSRLNEIDKADAHFDRAISLGADDPEILNNYAAFLCTNARYEKGEKIAQRAAANQLYKTPEIAYLNAGNCARNGGRLKAAEENYRRAIAGSPRFAPALFQMADLELSQSRFMSARAFLERYLSVARISPSSLWLAVRIEQGLGNTPGATEYARRLRNDYPSSPEARALAESERKAG